MTSGQAVFRAYNGKPISELDRETLLEALENACAENLRLKNELLEMERQQAKYFDPRYRGF